MSRRLVAATVVAVLAGGATALIVKAGAGDEPSAVAGSSRPTTATAEVTRQDISSRIDVDGTVGYSGEYAVINHMQGTVTAIPGGGTVVDRGQALYAVGNRPVPLLFGDVPAWRPMAEGMDKGPDVRQLEANLVALGFATESQLRVDDEFTGATTAAVKRWQKAMGLNETGTLEFGDVIFLPEAIRVVEARVDKGSAASPGAPVLSGSSTTRVVQIDLEATRQALVKEGDKVEVKLPSGAVTAGSVARVGTVAESKGQNESVKQVVPVTVGLDDQAASGTLDRAPVKVAITTASHPGVLTVPVNALLALSEGGYGVRVADTGQIVSVELGIFSRGRVEISGTGVTEGMKVEVPAS